MPVDAKSEALLARLEAFEARERGDALLRHWLAEGWRLRNKCAERPFAAVVAATTAFLAQGALNDPVSHFVAELCEIDMAAAAIDAQSGFYEFSATLFARYEKWHRAAGLPPMNITAFGRHLSALGFPPRRCGHRRLKARMGIRLKAAVPEA